MKPLNPNFQSSESAFPNAVFCQQSGKGRKYKIHEHLEAVSLRGTWEEMGRQYGDLLKQELRLTLEWANRHGNEASDSFFSPNGIPSGMDFMDEFFRGVTETSGLTLAELIRANGIEVAYGNELTDVLQKGGRCGALAIAPSKTKDGKLIFCRNYDWLPSFTALDLIICVMEPQNEVPSVSINFAGCLYLTTGMNAEGLFVELNSGIFASEKMDLTRRQNAWELWNVLRSSSKVEQGLSKLGTTPAAAYYMIGLGDREHAALFEWAVDVESQAHFLDPKKGYLAFTNHFIRPNWKNSETASLGGNASSIKRRQALLKLSEALPQPATLEDLQALLDVDIFHGGAKWNGTLFQIIAIPEDRRLMILPKDAVTWIEIPWTDLLTK